MEKTKHVKSEAVKSLEELALRDLKKRYPSFPYPPKPKFNDKTSNTLTKCIITYTRLRGFFAERVNATGQQIKTGNTTRWVKGSSHVGSADVHAVIQGRAVMIEIKIGNDFQSQAQRDYQKKIEQSGGVYLIVRTFQDYYNWFNKKGA